ncbi:MAG: type II and III secretion system protein [Candidatus Hydrogenedentes bacterium]|nr:type II and III secretion system protein [Candidatus Hydrogenedentota bacterium]
MTSTPRIVSRPARAKEWTQWTRWIEWIRLNRLRNRLAGTLALPIVLMMILCVAVGAQEAAPPPAPAPAPAPETAPPPAPAPEAAPAPAPAPEAAPAPAPEAAPPPAPAPEAAPPPAPAPEAAPAAPAPAPEAAPAPPPPPPEPPKPLEDIRQTQVQVWISETNEAGLRDLGVNLDFTRFVRGREQSGSVQEVRTDVFNPVTDFDRVTLPVPNQTAFNPAGTTPPMRPDETGTLADGLQTRNGFGLTASVIDTGTGTIDAAFRGIERKEDVDLISKPEILVINGGTAEIKAGGEIPYQDVQYPKGAPELSVKWRPIGVSMKLTPTILPNDFVQLQITQLEVTDIARIENSRGVDLPVFSKRSQTGFVQVPSGQTLVIGGLSSRVVRETERRVPIVGKLPILGFPFRSRNSEERGHPGPWFGEQGVASAVARSPDRATGPTEGLPRLVVDLRAKRRPAVEAVARSGDRATAERFPERGRDLDRYEAILGVKVVFSAFVNDSNVPVSLRGPIRHYTIYLVQFKGHGVVFVIHADHKSGCGLSCRAHDISRGTSFVSSPAAQCRGPHTNATLPTGAGQFRVVNCRITGA